jgi:hypothetical protein
MKRFAFGLLILGLLAGDIPAANAVVCEAGVHRLGCIGRHGAAVTQRRFIPCRAGTHCRR